MSVSVETEYIAFSDPSLNLSPDLALGWYAGTSQDDIQNDITIILKEIVLRTSRHLLFVGGSGGGFASLYYANRIGSMASAFVWNPQTDILDYAPNSVAEYLRVALSLEEQDVEGLLPGASPDWKLAARSKLNENGIDSRIGSVDCARIFYLQNATDWHLRKHLAPFIDAGKYVHRGNGLYTNQANHCVVVSAFGTGHAVPPHLLIQTIIREMLRPDRSVRKVYNSVVAQGVLPRDFRQLPVDLRGDWARGDVVSDIVLEPMIGGYKVRVVSARPSGYGGLTGYLTAVKDGNVVMSHPMSPSFTSEVKLPSVDGVSIRFQDGFGNVLGSLEKLIETENSDEKEELKPRVFLFGSCVSRDAFQLEEAPVLVDYVARSTLSSALGKPSKHWQDIDLSTNSSAFQRRVVGIDLHKQFRSLLASKDYDVLLIDFIDERLRAIDLDDGILTYSPELQRSGFSLPLGKVIEFGSDVYFERFYNSFDLLLSIVPREKIIINRVYWASRDSGGSTLEDIETIQRANDSLSRIYSYISANSKIRFIEYSDDELTADIDHRWGLSPFHYTESFYRNMIDRLSIACQS